MGFRLVPNSVTLNDLARRNRPNGCVISPTPVAFWADCVNVNVNVNVNKQYLSTRKSCNKGYDGCAMRVVIEVVEDTRILSAAEM